jgi:uncharacterized repeat protein (TIGR01451 family)
VQNNGTITEPGIQLGYANDGQLMLSGVAPSLFIQQDAVDAPNWYSITNTFPALAPGASQTFDVTYNVPANLPIGTAIDFKDTVAYATPMTNWLNDYSPWDNVNEYQTFAVGSFDPNEKEVAPIGTGEPGYIATTDSILTYTVRFQNTGTFQAYKVVVIDTLNSNLDYTTLKPGYSNHAYVADMSETGIVKFTFDNINLPDSTNAPQASIGVISYSVKQRAGLTGGTQITSPASVYFDFNPPARTNSPLNTIAIATDIKDVKQPVENFHLYPNPTNSIVHITIDANETTLGATLKFYNLVGEVMQIQNISLVKGKNTLTADLRGLSSGFYFAEINDGQHSLVQKVSVIK